MTNQIVAFSLLCFLAIFMMQHGYADSHGKGEYFNLLDTIKSKSGTVKLFGISGHTELLFANMTVTYPNETVKNSELSLTRNGDFQTFVLLETDDPAGLYRVEIRAYNSTMTMPSIDRHFFLSDYDGMVDVRIPRNAVFECDDEGSGDNENGYCTDPKTSHIPKSFGIRFFNDDSNNHQMKIDDITSDVILPGGDAVMFPTRSGEFDFNCVIHPWINGRLGVTDVSSIKRVIDAVANNTTKEDFKYDDMMPNDAKGIDIKKPDYDTQNCGVCYVGKITEIIDGDTIHVDGKPIRLALIDTPEENQEGFEDSANFVKKSCPINSFALIDIDDKSPDDGYGAKFAEITCGTTNINESLMGGGLAQMYDYSCTASEFMHRDWTDNNCQKQFDVVEKEMTPKIQNTTTTTAAVTSDQIISEVGMMPIAPSSGDDIIIYIIITVTVIAVCIALFSRTKNSGKEIAPRNVEIID